LKWDTYFSGQRIAIYLPVNDLSSISIAIARKTIFVYNGISMGNETVQQMKDSLGIRTVQVTRYVTPLREGGSLPAIAEADDGFLYVLKFRGAGQGARALIADFIGGEMARAAGFKVPEIVFANLDEAFGRTEPDEEIQDLLRASEGMNLGLHFLSGAITFDPAVTKVDSDLASRIVWLDALLTNVDRTARNTNMLTWHNEIWLIDHGASLYFHHTWDNWKEQSERPFTQIKDHVLLSQAGELDKAGNLLKSVFTEAKIRAIVEAVPDTWLKANENAGTLEDIRNVYINFLLNRINHSAIFVNEANHARQSLI
jgi:hypothetical protein